MTTSFRTVNLRRAWFAGVLVLALAACGGSSDSGIGADTGAGSSIVDVVGGGGAVTDPAVTSTTVPAAAIDADIKSLLALSSGERESQARVLSAQVERELLTISGVEAELGGAAATDAAFANLTAQFVAAPARTGADIIKLDPSQPRRAQVAKAAADESAAGALFGGYMEVSLLSKALLEQSGKELKPGQTEPFKTDHAKGEITLEKLIYDSIYDPVDASGLAGKLTTHLDVVACPNADGVFTIKATLDASMTKSGGATGERSTLEVSITGHVNDNADLAYYDVDTRMQMAEFVNRKGAYIDVNLNYPVGNSPRPASGKVNRAAGQVTDKFANQAYVMGQLFSLIIGIQLVDAAETAWKSGRCVALDPTTNPAQRTGLQPGTAVAITAAPRSKIDGGPVGGSVTGSLSGEGTLAPIGTKVPADASFTYTAASAADKAGTVSLEARSKRGVAKADLNFDTANDSWIGTASFSAPDMSTTAQITWVFVGSDKNVSMYKSTGPGTVAYNDGSCSYPATPSSTDGAGILFVDFNTTPPTFHGAGTTGIVTVTVTCKSGTSVETHSQPVALPVFGGTKGPEGVEAAGSAVVTQDAPMKIEGTDTDGVGGTFRWSFTRNR